MLGALPISFLITCLIIELTPGPNMTYLLLVAMQQGKRAGFATLAGIALGLLLIGIAAAYGLAAMFSAAPALYEALRIGGFLYLLWLAWDVWHEEETSSTIDDIRFFRHGLITNLLNPKALLFYVAVLPDFTDGSTALPAQTLHLTLLYVGVATLVHTLIVLLATPLRSWLQTPERQRFTRKIFALLLVVIALWLGLSPVT